MTYRKSNTNHTIVQKRHITCVTTENHVKSRQNRQP